MSVQYEKITLSDIKEMLEKLDLLLDGVSYDYNYDEAVINY